MRRRLAALPRNVVSLGVVSFVADFSSEMIYPVFPGFVTKVLGASAAVLGLIEGFAEATASLTRYPFGRLSDATGRRRRLRARRLRPGRARQARPGPGVRLAGRARRTLRRSHRQGHAHARRATPCFRRTYPTSDRGLAFGLHRTMDTAGAVLGPLIAVAPSGARRLAALGVRRRRRSGPAQRRRHLELGARARRRRATAAEAARGRTGGASRPRRRGRTGALPRAARRRCAGGPRPHLPVCARLPPPAARLAGLCRGQLEQRLPAAQGVDGGLRRERA